MISEISIQNFKSVEDLQLHLGRVTVLIGENGSGKSNILEGIAMIGAAAAGKLDNEFFMSRGIRATHHSLMCSAFPEPRVARSPADSDAVKLSAKNGSGLSEHYRVIPNAAPKEVSTSAWVSFPNQPPEAEIARILASSDASLRESVRKAFAEMAEAVSPPGKAVFTGEVLDQMVAHFMFSERLADENRVADKSLHLAEFLIYAPENTSLRRFEEEGQIQPLGIKGEGLFKLLQSFSAKDNKARLAELKRSLDLTGWFLDFSIPPNLAPGESRLRIHDRYLGPKIELDQRSANEGFLFLLFYFALFLSRSTPQFFAIDNIDTSLNPKLCAALMQRLCELAKKYDKQVIVTTHNPALLDGLDLHDEDQRLYAVYRNEEGRTKARRISPPKTLKGEAPLKLSHAFLRGLIGGLPKNF